MQLILANRLCGYTRIYKIVQCIGDAAKMAIIELITVDNIYYSKSKKRCLSAERSRKNIKQNSEVVDTVSEKPASGPENALIVDVKVKKINETPEDQ